MKATFITIALALLLGGGGTFLWLYYGGFAGEQSKAVAFIDVYGDYAEVAERVELLVHLPGTQGNSDRAELLSLLEAMLTQDMSSERREELARLAFSNLDTIKREIDAAQAAQAELYEALQRLDNNARNFSSIDLRKRAEEIVVLARKRAEISARITSILSETNDHTYAIITRILAEKGELSQQHITEINEATDDAQQRFETLEGLYAELIQQKEQLEASFASFAASAI